MAGAAVETFRRGLLYDGAQIHDGNPLAEMLHQGQVVRNEQIGQAELLLQILEQIDDLGLNGEVECRNGLVGDDQLRVRRQRAGNTDALALPAGKFMRVAPGMIGAHADLFQ